MTQNTTPPGFPAAEAGAKSPRLPPKDRIIKVTAYRRADGWITVTVYYEVEGVDEVVNVERARYYIPAQRAPVRRRSRWAQWTSRRYIELWLKAVEEYIRDVSQVIDFAAARAGEEAAKALREFSVVIKAVPSANAELGANVINLGLVAGGKVVELGPPPDLEYVGVTVYDPALKWERPVYPPAEYFRGIAYTYRWREAVEGAAGCEVAGGADGGVRVRCGPEELAVPIMVPPGEADGVVKALRGLADAMRSDLARREPFYAGPYRRIVEPPRLPDGRKPVEVAEFRITKIKGPWRGHEGKD